MKKTTCSVKSLIRRLCTVIGAAALVAPIHNSAYATQTVRELFDGLNAGHDYSTIDGLANQDVTTVGLQGSWETFPKGYDSTGTNWVSCTNIVYKDTWTLNWPLANLEYSYGGEVLSDTGTGANGLLNANLGGLNQIIDTNTGLAFGQYTSQSYATRPLTPGAWINFQTNSTNYFSVRIVKSYPWAVGDSAAGIGFSTGSGANDHFVGVGVTRTEPFYAADGVTDIGNASYISAGTLGQAGLASHPDDSGGPYYPVALGATGHWTNILDGARIDTNPSSPTYGQFDGICAGLLLGRIITTPSGASELDVKAYLPQAPIYTNIVNGVTNITLEQDINNIAWETTYNFTETNVMNNLLIWMYGTTMEYDAIRVGTTYGDVVGLELIGAPQISPNVTNYAGTTVTISQNAALNDSAAPMSFQWLSNSVPLAGATNSSLVLPNPDTSFTADYSVIVSNIYGTLTSPSSHLTINPAVPPFFVANGRPVSLTRYVGSPAATFTTHVDGTPPFTYQWQHAGTNIFSATVTASQNNTLVLPPIAVADAGDYSVIVTNAFGSTNSAVPGPVATLAEIVPMPGTYAAAVTTLPNLFGYWRLDDGATTSNPAIYDYWGANNGQANVSDMSNGRFVFQTVGAPFFGFVPPPHEAVQIGASGNGSLPYRLNLSKLVYSNTMTFTMWVNGGCQFVNHNGYNAGWGLENNSGLQFDWNGYDPVNKTNITWNSGLTVPANTWTFVALVVEPTQATVYVGADRFSLASASSGPLMTVNGAFTNSDSTTIGDTPFLYPFGIGRNQWPWAEDGNGAPWASASGTWSDVAIYYQSLTAQQITNLYETAVGLAISGQPDGAGNLNLNWFPAYTLQEAPSLAGPWGDVSGSPAPPYLAPISTTASQHFYRVRR